MSGAMGWRESETRHEEFREVARDTALHYVQSMPIWEPLESRLAVKLTAINRGYLETWKATWPEKAFDWQGIDAHFGKDASRFEACIWYDSELCGLVVGRVSNGPDNVTIHFLEKKRPANPLSRKIALIATEAATRYAKILGKQRVKIMDPVPDAIVVYERLLFVLAKPIGKTTYYERQVGENEFLGTGDRRERSRGGSSIRCAQRSHGRP
jgi:hypothetical protein